MNDVIYLFRIRLSAFTHPLYPSLLLSQSVSRCLWRAAPLSRLCTHCGGCCAAGDLCIAPLWETAEQSRGLNGSAAVRWGAQSRLEDQAVNTLLQNNTFLFAIFIVFITDSPVRERDNGNPLAGTHLPHSSSSSLLVCVKCVTTEGTVNRSGLALKRFSCGAAFVAESSCCII